MHRTKRVLGALVAVAVFGCSICQPTPSPTPSPETFWEPVGAAQWPDASVTFSINPELQQGFAGQGADIRHLIVDFDVAREQLGPQQEVRVLVRATRPDGTQAYAGSTLRTFGAADLVAGEDGGFHDLVLARICPPRDGAKILGLPLTFDVALAKESDHGLLQRGTVVAAPQCPSGSCPCQ